MKVLLAVYESRDANVAAKCLENVYLPRGSSVTILHIVERPRVAPQFPGYYSLRAAWREAAVARGNRLVTSIAKRLRNSRLRIRTLVVEGVPRPDLLKAIRRLRIDLAVLGPHAFPRLARFFLGSVSEYTLSEAPCSVLIARSRRRATTTSGPRVILTTDFSRDADAAATFLSRLDLPRSSQITMVHVEERAEDVLARLVAKGRTYFYQALAEAVRARRQHLARLLDRVGRRFARRGWRVNRVLGAGYPTEEILRVAARQPADLIVLGSRGVTGFTRMLLGSVSRTVARHAPCSVLVVRRTRR